MIIGQIDSPYQYFSSTLWFKADIIYEYVEEFYFD